MFSSYRLQDNFYSNSITVCLLSYIKICEVQQRTNRYIRSIIFCQSKYCFIMSQLVSIQGKHDLNVCILTLFNVKVLLEAGIFTITIKPKLSNFPCQTWSHCCSIYDCSAACNTRSQYLLLVKYSSQ